jgi:hypothetical protein
LLKVATFATNKPRDHRYQNKSDNDECRKSNQNAFGKPGAEQVCARPKRDEPARIHDGYVLPEHFPEIASFFSVEVPGRDDSVSAWAGPRAEMRAMPADEAPEHDYGK